MSQIRPCPKVKTIASWVPFLSVELCNLLEVFLQMPPALNRKCSSLQPFSVEQIWQTKVRLGSKMFCMVCFGTGHRAQHCPESRWGGSTVSFWWNFSSTQVLGVLCHWPQCEELPSGQREMPLGSSGVVQFWIDCDGLQFTWDQINSNDITYIKRWRYERYQISLSPSFTCFFFIDGSLTQGIPRVCHWFPGVSCWRKGHGGDHHTACPFGTLKSAQRHRDQWSHVRCAVCREPGRKKKTCKKDDHVFFSCFVECFLFLL